MNPCTWSELPFTQIITDATSKASKVNQSHFQETGNFPIIDQGDNFIAAYIDDESLVWKGELPVIVFGDHTRALKYVDFPFVLGADGAKVLKPVARLWPRFAYFALMNLDIPSAGYSRHYKFLKETTIRFPPLPEQKRIAAILAKADRLRRLRRYARTRSDTYLQSVFLEMFGDLIENHNGWQFHELGSIADIASGVTKGRKLRGKLTLQIPYLRVANVQDGYLDLEEIKFIEALPSDLEKLRLQVGDILMTEGGDFDKLGRGAIWQGQVPDCIHQNHIFRVRLDPQYAFPEFFASFLLTRFAKSYFLAASKQTTNLATINMTQLRRFPVPLPPLRLQQQFGHIVSRFQRLRAQQSEAERQAEHLFQTLLHRAFRGEI